VHHQDFAMNVRDITHNGYHDLAFHLNSNNVTTDSNNNGDARIHRILISIIVATIIVVSLMALLSWWLIHVTLSEEALMNFFNRQHRKVKDSSSGKSDHSGHDNVFTIEDFDHEPENDHPMADQMMNSPMYMRQSPKGIRNPMFIAISDTNDETKSSV
jgi:hypothetical protein